VLESGKEYLVEARLAPIAKSYGLASIEDLVDRLDRTPGLAVQVVEAMTTNETSFFRDYQPFEILKNEIIPELIAKREKRRTLDIWSAACSSGQEPYSIAILLRDHFPELTNWNVRILATDLSNAILERARAARFSQLEVNRGLGAAQLVKHFDRAGLHWDLKPELRNMVTFLQLNLVNTWPILPTFDIVFLRNILIYFDLDTKRSIFAKLHEKVAHDGYVFLGAGESTVNIDSAFERVIFERAGCYRVAAAPLSQAQAP
jgi:chemotaxis protein methyltransferase CheR